jgi:Predicted acetyltransferase
MKIEKLQMSDIASYKNLIDTCFGGSDDLEHYRNHYDDNAPYEIIVAKDNDVVVGSITFYKIDLFTFSFQPALEIFNVSVLPEYQGKKIAKNIFNYITNFAKENGYKSIFLTCLDSATNAHHLYESVGFKKMNSFKYNLSLTDIND